MRVFAACACLMVAVTLQVWRDRAFPRADLQMQRLLYVRSPATLQRLVLGFDALAADVYWIRAVQHFGGDRLERTRPRRFELLYPLLDIATSLDPYFTAAYRFGAIFLSEAAPGGAGRPDYAVALLRKGIAAQPDKWQYYHDIAFVQYLALRDPVAAAEWFRKGAEQPGAPDWLLPVAASMLTKQNDRGASRFLWQQMLGSEQEWLRRRAQHALLQLQALDEIDRMTAYIAALPRRPDQPYSWAWLLRIGAFRVVPPDPAGVPYELDPVTGRVTVSSSSLLFPLPRALEAAR